MRCASVLLSDASPPLVHCRSVEQRRLGQQVDRLCRTHFYRDAAHENIRYMRLPLLYPLPPHSYTGICFGHEIIARALGSTLDRVQWEVSVTTIHLTHIGRAIFHADKLVRSSCSARAMLINVKNLQMMHTKQVAVTPAQRSRPRLDRRRAQPGHGDI